MSDEPLDDLDPGELDPFLIAQAARTHAQRAEEKASSLEGRVGDVAERMWTKVDHEAFLEVAKESYKRAMHRITVLLTFSVIALVMVIGLVVAENIRSSRVDDVVDHRVDTLVDIATESCERANQTLENTRTLYRTLATTTASPQVAAELGAAAERLPAPSDCSRFQDLNQ